MLKGTLLTMVLLVTIPLWSQVGTEQTEGAANPSDDQRMETPPPVSGAPYQDTTLSESRSNYLRGSLMFNTAYNDNVGVSDTGKSLSDVSYSIWPSIALDDTTSRLHFVLRYSPGFTFYQRFSSLDQTDQSVGLSFQYRLSPHVTFSARDSFHKTSSPFNQPDFLSTTPVSGSVQAPVVSVVAPIADQLRNVGSVELTYQFSASQMIGGSGTFANLHYVDQSQVTGLYDSSSAGGSFFYSHRLSRRHYLGATYQYQRIVAYPVGPQNLTQTHAILGFYTVYLKPTLSLSVSAGPQYSYLEQAPLPPAHSWAPAETASVGWQLQRTSLAASFSHLVSGGGGLVGAFHSTVGNGTVRQQLGKTWTAAASAGYSLYATVNPLFALPGSAGEGGHSVYGTVSISHQWTEHLRSDAAYSRLHQSYAGIPVLDRAPDTNREYISISYEFSRPIGR
jgi:hypothetical protein